jgi:hypothetical protein
VGRLFGISDGFALTCVGNASIDDNLAGSAYYFHGLSPDLAECGSYSSNRDSSTYLAARFFRLPEAHWAPISTLLGHTVDTGSRAADLSATISRKRRLGQQQLLTSAEVSGRLTWPSS